MSALVVPALLSVELVDRGNKTYRLTIIRTFFSDEGSALLERIDGNARLDFVQNGTWRIARPDDGPATLHVDFDDSGDVHDMSSVMDWLLRGCVDPGAQWGIESVAVWS